MKWRTILGRDSAARRLERPKRSRSHDREAWTQFLLMSCLFFAAGSLYANPQGMTVVSGSAHATQHGNTLQINTSRNAFLQWNSFNIAPGELTVFHQPSATSIVFNNINNANPTTIYGSLQANGIVVLENQSGFYFGPNAFVKAGGLVVTTAAVNQSSASGGPEWSFDGPPTQAPIVNYGHLETANGGSLFLIGKEIENNGTVLAPGGTAALVAGQEVLLSERPNGLSLAAPVQLPAGSVDNHGNIVADAGQVLLQAQTVNNSGLIQANSVRQQNGVIELYASQDIQLTGSSVIQANGDTAGVSQGGSITIKSGGTFSDSAGSQIAAAGGASGGNGGTVEVSAPNILSLYSKIDASAQQGWSEGSFSLDPEDIVLGNFSSGSTSAGASGVIAATGSSGTVDVDVGSAFQNIVANILLQASGNITLNPFTTWDLSQSTGKTTGQLTLEAGGNITFGSGLQPSAITDENNWSVTLEAGFNFATGHGVIPGVGNVDLSAGLGSAGSMIETATGNITVLAGNNVTLGLGGIVTGIANGAVITAPGGNINVQAVAGNVNCGSNPAGYLFGSGNGSYTVDPALGGVSTANGGNVNIVAGGNISAVLTSAGNGEDCGSGAFGTAPGNVTLIAGGNVTGHYVVADGSGRITCQNAGTANDNLALSLINGGWTVNAANDIYLQEVRNPNGTFNNNQYDPFEFLYDYDPLASVVLDAGNGVTITGSGLPRVTGGLQGLIFPPSLTIEAGAGGVTLGANLSLFPSPEGGLVITTTDGGNLNGENHSIYVSPSESVQWTGPTSFGPLDPANNDTLHLNDPNPVLVSISGSVSDLALSAPQPVQMYVAGNQIDCAVSAVNLRPSDISSISVGGEILDHSSYILLPLPSGEIPNLKALAQLADPYLIGPNNTQVSNPNFDATLYEQDSRFLYDSATGTLTYSGIMSSAVEAALIAMRPTFLPAATIEQIYTQSQSESLNAAAGYTIAGPGILSINAGSINLGNSKGIVSLGISGASQLTPYTARGADIDISSSGDINMYSSAILSDYGGNINISCGGAVDVGSVAVPPASDTSVVGIVSLWSGNISVVANGDVNVDGSRIAAYDGGNIFVESLHGNVDAGNGGGQPVLIQKPYVNAQGQLEYSRDEIPGSGILATSYPQLVNGETSSQIGNITVETPQGNIEASKGGIVQLALGSGTGNDATITLNAGSKNANDSVAYVGNVDASGSGVIGGQVNITATGNVNGLVVASLGATVSALQNVSATVLSQGGVAVSAGGTVSGTIVGVGSVTVSGASDAAAAFSASSVSTSGSTSGAAVAAAPTGSSSAAAAATTQQVNQSTQPNSDLAANSDDNDPLKKKKKKKAQLMEYVGRVTVLLPE